MKRVNTRVQTMISRSLNHSDVKENDNQDFYDSSQPSSPMQISADFLRKRRRSSTHGVVDNSHEKITCKGGDGISDPNLSPELLTVSAKASLCPLPSPLSLATNLVMKDKTIFTSIAADDVESVVEKSIEPPPYSPLTPHPVTADTFAAVCADFNTNNALQTSKSLTEISAEKSVSPLPFMSPETASLLNILADSTDNFFNTEGVTDMTIASLRSSEAPLYIDSDDSVRDPNYCANADNSSSDDSSNNSISLISGSVCTEIIQIANGINEIASHQPETINLGFKSIISENVNTNNDQLNIEAVSVHETQTMGRPKKGRKPKYGGLSREERKKRKYTNLPYVNSKKKLVSSTKFIDFQCSCLKKCHEKVPVEKRLAQFEKFYSLGSYNAQNIFLTALVKEQPVKRHYVSTDNKTKVSRKKSYSRQYFLDGESVCRDMFVKTFQTSAKRINTSLCKMRSSSCIIDNRGVHGGCNRTSPQSEEFFINFIKKLPSYVSHYRRQKTEGAKFLRADMTLSKINELYSNEAKTAGVNILSVSKVNKLFFTKFNLRTKPLKKDTCNKCDFFESQIQSSEQNRAEIEQKRVEHQETADSLQKQLRIDMKRAEGDPTVETLSFDLEKTLPLPCIPTNIVFYKRQLWVYNLGIHTGTKDEAHCNVWVEGEAGRGAQEVGSCLIKHITKRLDRNVKFLILWSDSCGGQNRNIKLILMLKAMLNEHPTLDQINIKFLESGHSFLPNYTDFGKIECALKHQQRLYTPDDYIQVMKTFKKTKPMHVHRMKNEDFLSSLKLEKNIINRKKTIDGQKVSWLHTKEIMIKKDEMFKIYMRTTLNEDFKVVDVKKNVRGRYFLITKALMEPLWPTGKPVPDAKLRDLKSMLHLIPKDSHNFYVNLVGNEDLEDDIEGFSGQPDFDIELDLD